MRSWMPSSPPGQLVVRGGLCLCLLLIMVALTIPGTDAFVAVPTNMCRVAGSIDDRSSSSNMCSARFRRLQATETGSDLSESSSEFEADHQPKDRSDVNLVNQALYLQSIDQLQKEVAALKGVEYEAPKNPPVYALGRFEVPLRIDSAPGLDLTETAVPLSMHDVAAAAAAGNNDNDNDNDTKGLVLITMALGNAAEAGLQPLDTIVGVKCSAGATPFEANVNSQSLETTAMALQAAMAHALEHGVTEIDLEVNRLISGYF